LTKTAPAEGGFTAPTEWDRTITDKLVIISPMRQMCSVQSISVNAFSKLFNNKGTVSGWVGETAARPETATPTFGSVTYVTGELYANPSATQQMLDDSEVDLEQWLAGEVEQEFSLQENIAFVSGTGANGRPNGILTYVTGAANAAAHPYGAITLTNSGAAATVTADGIVNLVHALPSAFLQNAQFAMNRDTMRAVRLLKDTTNQYLWQPSYQAGTPSTLAGYGVSEVAAMPNLAAASKSILFGDFKRSYLIVDRVGVRLLRDPFTNKPYVMFYTTKRVGGGLLNPESMKALNTAV
jgi:HK97 family phage major capsid protein